MTESGRINGDRSEEWKEGTASRYTEIKSPGAVIKELREKNKLTQLQLADKLGVSDKTISKWETGKGYR